MKTFDSLHGVRKNLKGKICELAREMYIRTISDYMSHKLKTEKSINNQSDFDINNADVVWDECVDNASIAILNLCSKEKDIDKLLDEYSKDELEKINYFV